MNHLLRYIESKNNIGRYGWSDAMNLSDDYLLNIASDLDTPPTDLRIAHLNIRSLRNKI